jgi:lauroyl/myristoyl acyltransferase
VSRPLDAAAGPGPGGLAPAPRWYTHPYNRPLVYRLTAALSRLGRPTRLALARAVGALVAGWLPAERDAVRLTLATVTGLGGAALDRLTRRTFAEFAMCFTDLVAPPDRWQELVAAVRGREHLGSVPGALISLTAHVGNWDLAGRLLAAHTARPTRVVVAAEEVRALETWLRRHGAGVRFVARGDPRLGVDLLAALRRGHVVAAQGDRALGNAGDVRVPFFGRPAPFPVGPFRLAGAARVPVLPAFCTLGSDGRYVLTLLPPLAVERGAEVDGLRAWVAALERVVAERPTQWFNFFNIWNPSPRSATS